MKQRFGSWTNVTYLLRPCQGLFTIPAPEGQKILTEPLSAPFLAQFAPSWHALFPAPASCDPSRRPARTRPPGDSLGHADQRQALRPLVRRRDARLYPPRRGVPDAERGRPRVDRLPLGPRSHPPRLPAPRGGRRRARAARRRRALQHGLAPRSRPRRSPHRPHPRAGHGALRQNRQRRQRLRPPPRPRLHRARPDRRVRLPRRQRLVCQRRRPRPPLVLPRRQRRADRARPTRLPPPLRRHGGRRSPLCRRRRPHRGADHGAV